MSDIELAKEELEKEGRPISQNEGNQAVFERRREKYESWCDAKVKSGEHAAEEILELFEK